MELLSETLIAELIKNLKMSGNKVHSNSYMRFTNEERTWNVSFSSKSLVILNIDHGINRLLFYTTDFEELKELMMTSLIKDEEYVLEIVSKDAFLYRENLIDMGFQVLAELRRVSVRDVSLIFQQDEKCLEIVDESLPIQACVGDAESLRERLWEIFDTRISHLPDLPEIVQSIENGEFCVYKDKDSKITAFLQSVVTPKSFYVNQVYNGAEKKVIHSIMHVRLKEYCENGGRYAYAWVEEKNVASLKFHAKYGMQPDGLHTNVYTYKVK